MLWSLTWPITPYIVLDAAWLLAIGLLCMCLVRTRHNPVKPVGMAWLILSMVLLWRVALMRSLTPITTNELGQPLFDCDIVLTAVTKTLVFTMPIPMVITFGIFIRMVCGEKKKWIIKCFEIGTGALVLIAAGSAVVFLLKFCHYATDRGCP